MKLIIKINNALFHCMNKITQKILQYIDTT